MLALIDDIKGMAGSTGAELKEKKGVYTLRLTVAERKAVLSRKKLEYVARFRVDYDWSAIRTWMEQAAAAAGYSFNYSIVGKDL